MAWMGRKRISDTARLPCVRPNRAGDPRQGRAVVLLEHVLDARPSAQATRQTRGPPTAPGVGAKELLDLVHVGVLIQAVLGAVGEHPAAEQVVKMLPVIGLLGSIGAAAKV